MPPTVLPPRRYVSGMELLRLVWLFALHCMHPKSYTSVGFSFLDALTIFQLISVDLAAPYHSHIQCKGLHFRGWLWCFDLYLILQFGLYSEFFL